MSAPLTSDSPAQSQAASWRAPAAIFALALAVRVVGLTWGLPNAQRFYSYHPDESPQQIVGAVFHLLQGDFNPHFFNYPSLTVYATWLFYQILSLAGQTTNAPGAHYPWDVARDVILAGRLFSVLCGAGTAAFSYGIARQLGLNRGALVAGITVALLPGLVQHSHFATVDVPATFFVVWCVWLSLRARTGRAILVAALVAGLAAGAKYNAGLVAIVPMICALQLPLKNRWLLVVLAPVLALLGFLVTTPFAVLDFPEFWGNPSPQVQTGISFELLTHPRIGSGDLFQGTGNGWLYHLTFNLPFIMTAPLEIFALLGLGLAARERRWWPVLVFVGLFFLSLGFSQVRFMRYLFPIAPFLCVTAAYAAARLPKPQVWGAALVLVVAAALPGIIQPFVSVDPRDSVAQIIKRDGRKPVALAHNPWFYTPPFQPEGFNHPVPNTIVIEFENLGSTSAPIITVSEFEFRESQRLDSLKKNPRYYDQSTWISDLTAQFETDPHQFYFYPNYYPWSLPGREFVPHDYLYPNPQTWIFISPKP